MTGDSIHARLTPTKGSNAVTRREPPPGTLVRCRRAMKRSAHSGPVIISAVWGRTVTPIMKISPIFLKFSLGVSRPPQSRMAT
jgi:hypothetical protein